MNRLGLRTMRHIHFPSTIIKCTVVTMVSLGTCALKPLERKPEPQPRPVSAFVLGQSAPMPVARFGVEQLSERFPAFQAKSQSNEYSHVVLPFKGGPGEDEKLKAYAFSFLLSNALDWGPGCYCSRHAYFTFKRSGLAVLDAGMTLRPASVEGHAQRWKATHVFGGDIQAGPQGYTGALKVFAPNGHLLHEKRFDAPCRYFDLLGAMSVEGLRVLGYEPSPALAAHLRIPRCKDERLLVDLGRAAFADERSDEEFGLYRAILEKEPGFAEVRYWWANQLSWVTEDTAAYHRALAQSLRHYITCVALQDVDLSPEENQGPGFGYDWLIGETERLTGPNTPLAWLLRFKGQTGTARKQAIAATEVAAQYPNNFKLLLRLMGRGQDESSGIWGDDYSMIASLAVATLKCRYLPSSHASRGAEYRLGLAARELGYPAIAAQMLGPFYAQAMANGSRNDTSAYGWRLAEVLQDMGQYDASFQVGVTAAKTCDNDGKLYYLLNALISGLMAGRTNEVAELAGRYDREMAAKPLLHALLKVYQAMAKGDYAAVQAYAKAEPVSTEEIGIRVILDRMMLYAELDLKLGRTDYRQQVRHATCVHPALRPLWILFDAYDRKDPRPEDEGFYEALRWLHPDDPWVQQAIVARSHRVPSPREFDLKGTLATLDDYPPPPWPIMQTMRLSSGRRDILLDPPAWDYVCAVKRMLAMQEYDRADELTRQCMSASRSVSRDTREPFFVHLYYLVQAARAKDASPKPRTLPTSINPWLEELNKSPVLRKILEQDTRNTTNRTTVIYH